jgi:putative transposase
MVKDTTGWPALREPVDGLGELIRAAARHAIETAVAAELETALGAGAWARVLSRRGYRHGTQHRTLVTGEGSVTFELPRARLQQADGTTAEWRSVVVPRVVRRQPALDAVLARLYLSGASTRDLRRALAPLFGRRALSRSAISRVVGKLHAEYTAWRTRSLATEPLAYLFVDGQRLRVRAGERVTTISVLLALGVRTTGEKVVLGLQVARGERTEAWSTLLEELARRGLRRPTLVVSDGSRGAQAALEALWPGVAHQRCLVHKLRNLVAVTPPRLQAALVQDFRRISQALTPADVAAAVGDFRRAWAKRWSAAVVSLDEAGPGLTAFTRCPAAQWKSLRSTNGIERVFGEFRRRVKTQGALPTPEALLIVLWGTLASGGIRLRKIDGHDAFAAMEQAA